MFILWMRDIAGMLSLVEKIPRRDCKGFVIGNIPSKTSTEPLNVRITFKTINFLSN